MRQPLLMVIVLSLGIGHAFGQTTFSNFGTSHRDFRPSIYRSQDVPGSLRSSYGWSNYPSNSSYYRSVYSGSGGSSSTTSSYYGSTVYSSRGLDASQYLYPSGSSSRSRVTPTGYSSGAYPYSTSNPYTHRATDRDSRYWSNRP